MWTLARRTGSVSYRRLTNRLYSTHNSGNSGNASAAQKSRFDKSMLKPALIVVLFGSMLTSVMEQQKKNAELERRYALKIGILKDLMVKVQNNEVVDIGEELALVNKLFDRFEQSKYVLLEEEASKIREHNEKAGILTHEQMTSRLNGGKSVDDDASLRDLFRDIMKDVDDDGKTLGSTPATLETSADANIPVQKTKSSPVPALGESGIHTDSDFLTQNAQNEKERLKFKPATDSHVIVETPGDYSTSAEDREVSRFL
ncbi:LAME_0E00650g1_1 [Lachancea meyersii CBS 8951]|uniref:LAME_0E00650g1_1 n=1 Tax=Lachancea meyersii CBS 8951 TaxID=1266667 RepID=A0A1G4JEP2_9SACH|nr:LAME_0E00650g1_1 [Lachancea meyersii CBS 8951]